MKQQISFIDLFAGCGGMSKGLEMAGLKCVGFVEFWRPAIDTHLNNCGGELIGEDIIKIKDSEIKKYKGIDLICGGPPCQGFSMAGKRDPGDKRNRLFEEFIRFVRIIKPKFFIMENVAGIGSMKNLSGELVIHEIMEIFKGLGYSVDCKVLCSVNYGVAQKRRRAIFLGNRLKKKNIYPEFTGKKFLNEVLDLPYEQNAGTQHICETNGTKNMYKYSHVKEGKNYGLFRSTNKKLKMGGFSCTITKTGRYIHPVYNRNITVREAARIQSFPDSFIFDGKVTQMYQQIGNAVPCLMAKAIGETIKESLDGKS